MVDRTAPPQIAALAHERATARSQRDWTSADALKMRIEAAGWRVVDAGVGFELLPMRLPDVVEDDHVIFGALDSIPSRLDEPASVDSSVVVAARPGSPSLGAVLDALAGQATAPGQVVVVAGRETSQHGEADEVIRTVQPFSAGDTLQAGLRRVSGAVVIVLDSERQPGGDIVGPLIRALADPGVAVAGIEGLGSSDLRRYGPAGPGDVTALGAGCYAFRREDVVARGPIDGRLHLPGSVATWWSLVLRDEGPNQKPRRAVAMDLPVGAPDPAAPRSADHARLARRDAYRIADLLADRTWLGSGEPPQGRVVGDGADDGHDDDHADQAEHAAEA